MAGSGKDQGTRRLELPVGIAGEDLRREPRDVPAGEPPAWPPNAELAVVGKPTPRLEAVAKVTGAARYTVDVLPRGLLHARRIVSTVPHARITAVDTSAAEVLAGVEAVHVLTRQLEGPVLRDPGPEPPRWPTVRYLGQPLGAIAATTPEIAEEAVRRVKITYEPLPFVVDMEEALRPDAPRVYPGPVDQQGTGGGGGAAQGLPQEGNLRGPVRSGRGDVAKGFAQAQVIVEGVFTTQVQTHSPMETHAAVAEWQDGGLLVHASTQHVAGVRDDLAEYFALPPHKVRVVCEHMGGGFGAKFGAGHHVILAALLARKAGRPVRLALDRAEQHTSVGNRPATRQRLRIGARRDGTLTAIELDARGTAGVGTGAGVGWAAESLYACENVATSQADVFVNAGPGAAFRAPGMPQGIFALEQLLDELAERLGVDPLALRDRIDTSDDAAAVRRVERRVGAERIGWARRHAPGADPGPVKRGIGFAQSFWGHFVRTGMKVEVAVLRGGTVELRCATQDLGTGTRTALAQVVAEELGLRPADVIVKIGDSAWPEGPGSGGSNVTGTITPPARTAAHDAGAELRARAARRLGVAPEALALRGGRVVVKDDPARGLALAEAAALGKEIRVVRERIENYDVTRPTRFRGSLGGVQFAEVAVDVETGIVRVERIVAVHDCGRPINPLAVESQVNGGILHGLSWALLEDRTLDRATGRMVNPDLEQYKIAGARETPRIEVVLLESYRGRSATDAMGIGEPANVATAAAIANAVHNATGLRLRELPLTPARVLAALAARGA